MNVLMPNGFNLPRTLKVLLESDIEGTEAFVFMLPEENWPQSPDLIGVDFWVHLRTDSWIIAINIATDT